jgi:hypothetical protein
MIIIRMVLRQDLMALVGHDRETDRVLKVRFQPREGGDEPLWADDDQCHPSRGCVIPTLTARTLADPVREVGACQGLHGS